MARTKLTPLRHMRWDTALVLLNGELSRPSVVKRLCREGAALLCADGGARHAAGLGLEPRAIIGDMDSLPHQLPDWKGTAFVCDFDQETSDFEKALRFAVERKVKMLWVAGALGGRPDQTVVNLALMETYSDRIRLALAEEQTGWILPPGERTIPCRRGQGVTLLPATPEAQVTTEGLRYVLHNTLLARTSRGLSNQALAPSFHVEVHSGRLWVFCTP